MGRVYPTDKKADIRVLRTAPYGKELGGLAFKFTQVFADSKKISVNLRHQRRIALKNKLTREKPISE